MGSLLRIASFFLLLLTAAGFNPCEAQEMIDSDREANVKAVFLYSFGRFVVWPEVEAKTVDTDFVIALLGESRVNGKLQRIAASRKIAGRDIRLIQVKTGEPNPLLVRFCLSQATSTRINRGLSRKKRQKNQF